MTRWVRRDEFIVTLTIDGISYGSTNEAYYWATKTGGEFDSDTIRTRPGGMQPEISLGGTRTMGNITLSRPYSDRDHGRVDKLKNSVGKAKCHVAQYNTDGDGNPWGEPVIWTGILKRVSLPDYDANATADAATIEVEIDTDGDAVVGA